MPSSLTYPGVYVEELSSGVRTITGVATSVTAFIGRARRGPVDQAYDITSYADFERVFGGLWADSTMSFAVRDFYLNGGSQAVIVRVFHSSAQDAAASVVDAAQEAADAAGATGKQVKEKAKAGFEKVDKNGNDAQKAAAKAANDAIGVLKDDDKAPQLAAVIATARTAAQGVRDARQIVVVDSTDPKDLKNTALAFIAASPGAWAGYLRVQVEAASGPGLTQIASDLKVKPEQLFKLTVTDLGPGGVAETHVNVTMEKHCVRRIDKVLKDACRLIAWNGEDLDKTTPDAIDFSKVTVKGDALATAYAARDAAIKANPNPMSDPVVKAKEAVAAAQTQALASADDGAPLNFNDFMPVGGDLAKKGLNALEQLYTRNGIFNLLCIAPYTADMNVEPSLIAAAGVYCEKRRAMLLVDAPSGWGSVDAATIGFSKEPDQVGYRGRNAALFFPRLKMANPLHDNQVESFAACGAVAGIFARTDTQRGVWKSPAGLDASFNGVSSFTLPLTDEENGLLNPLGINCLRTFPVFGRVLWGARTLRGADAFADEYKYTAVRRTALFIEESLYRALKWVVFEPNDEPLWAQIRLNVGAFMHNLFRQGAFAGQTKSEAYFVKCDATTTTQNDVNLGVVNIRVGFAPLKPAEFVVIQLQQMAGNIET